MKYSKIEKAIVLSLLLSSSIYGTASADERISEAPTTQEFELSDNKTVGILNAGLSHHYTGDNVNINIVRDNEANLGISYGAWTYAAGYKGKTVIDVNSLNINIKNNVYLLGGDAGDYAVGIFSGPAEGLGNDGGSNTTITAKNSINLDVQTRNAQNGYGVYSQKNDNISLMANDGDITVNTSKSLFRYKLLDYIEDANYEKSNVYGINTKEGSINFNANGNIEIRSFISDTSDLSSIDGYKDQIGKLQKGNIYAVNNEKGTVELVGNNINLEAEAKEGDAYGIYSENAVNNYLNAEANINIISMSDSGNAYGIYLKNDNVVDKNTLDSTLNGIDAKNMTIVAKSNNGEAKAIIADGEVVNKDIDEVLYIQASTEKGAVGIEAKNNGNVSIVNKGNLPFSSNRIEALGTGSFGVKNDNSTVSLEAKNGGWNIIRSEAKNNQGNAISTTGENAITDIKGNVNQITAGNLVDGQYYAGTAINATKGSEVNIQADEFNYIGGTIRSAGDNTVVNLGTYDKIGFNHGGSNYIVSNGHGKSDEQSHIVSAVYAQDNGTINISADNEHINYIATKTNEYPEGNEQDKERAVWAEQGTINLFGKTVIETTNGSITEPNNVGIAIAAGGSDINDNSAEAGVVNAVLNNGSYIFGDILAGAKGKVDLNVNQLMPLADNDISKEGITIQGNILAANGGEVNANLGANSVLTGRIDSYMDATDHSEHGSKFFAPEFSNEIETKGIVSLTLGENSRWNLIGQSWVTNLNINGTGTMIDMVGSNTDKNESSHALTIENLKGDANFKMSLKGDEAHSNATDMIYIKNGNGNFNIIVDEAITEEDINDNGLRFATIGSGSDVKFKNVGTYNAGAFDVKYEVEASAYTSDDAENNRYNGEDFSEDKPGSDNIDDFFKSEEESIATLSIETKESDESAIATNYNIVGIAGRELNNIGKTIINLSRANYANAIYMDNMNQRLGEARYLEGSEGFWVKLGHNSIGKDNAFDIDNNVYQLGYDKLHQEENGARRIGVVADYMTGDTSYDNISANGEVSRKGLWLYDTWTGNDGHYTDFVAKWGHLENNFDIYVPDRDVVNGEYNNDVFTLSEEYGYKKSLGNNWYIEPQIQLQYAYITGADYMTSQDTNVKLDAVNSLISRAGFRLGREFGKDNKTNLYLKGNIMHEFLGDQDIKTWDNTGVLNDTFDNDGTWYNIGIGVSTVLSDSSYAYVDYERSFGNDNDNTYQVNGGVRWAF